MFDERYEGLTSKEKDIFAHCVNNLMLKHQHQRISRNCYRNVAAVYEQGNI